MYIYIMIIEKINNCIQHVIMYYKGGCKVKGSRISDT